MKQSLVIIGFVLILLGLFVMWLVPSTYIQTVEVAGEKGEAYITELGFNPLGIWISILGLAIVTVGATIQKEQTS